MIRFSQKPNADTEYLGSAITRDAIVNKFRNLFGREPVADGVDTPLRVEDGRVPDLILKSVEPEVARLLRASAIEASAIAAGEVPEIEGTTLLYIITDDAAASISLAAVPEYADTDPASADSTIAAINDGGDINISDGTAHLSPELSAIDIGIFVDNQLLAEEFQYRLESAGGEGLDDNAKTRVFDDVFAALPTGDADDANIREALLAVVGLTSQLTPEAEPPPGQKAPGPDAVAKTPTAPTQASKSVTAQYQTISLKEAIMELIDDVGMSWNAIAKGLKDRFGVDSEDLGEAQNQYLGMVSTAVCDHVVIDGGVAGFGSVVINFKYPTKVFAVIDICGSANDPDIVIEDSVTGALSIANKSELTTY